MPVRHGISLLASIIWLLLALAGAIAQARQSEGVEPAVVTFGTHVDGLDPALRIALHRGYFAAERLDVRIVAYDKPVKMLAPLATGQLAAASLPVNARLFNSLAGPAFPRIVADAATSNAGQATHAVMVRKAIVAAGRFKSMKELKGLRIATSAPGSGGDVMLAAMLKQAGLKPSDISHEHMMPALQVAGLSNAAIDVAIVREPFAARIETSGSAVRSADSSKIIPGRPDAVIVFSRQLASAGVDVGRRFMKAYLKGARDYNDALKDGRLTADAATIISTLLSKGGGLPTSLVRAMAMPAVNPDGKPDATALKSELQAHQSAGLIDGKVDIDAVVDPSFADWATAQLGPYRRR